MARIGVLGVSLLVHGAMIVGLGAIRARESIAATAISVVEKPQEKKQKAPEPAKVEPTPPAQKSRSVARKAAAPAPAPAPETPQAPQGPASLADVPDFGLELSGGGSGTGVALPVGGGGPAPKGPTKSVARSLNSAKPALAAPDPCTDDAGKPKPINLVQAAYTEQGRAAAVEGKVRVQITVDENGAVVDAKVLAGLGYGLDEQALAAARASTFQPAVRCGKPSRSTVTIGMRFTMQR
jgi:protein TonB